MDWDELDNRLAMFGDNDSAGPTRSSSAKHCSLISSGTCFMKNYIQELQILQSEKLDI